MYILFDDMHSHVVVFSQGSQQKKDCHCRYPLLLLHVNILSFNFTMRTNNCLIFCYPYLFPLVTDM